MLHIADKFDIPPLLQMSLEKLCELSETLHFIDQSDNGANGGTLARLLAIADRHNMPELKRRCQYAILRDVVSNPGNHGGSAKTRMALTSLEAYCVSPRSMGEICCTLAELILNEVPRRQRGTEAFRQRALSILRSFTDGNLDLAPNPDLAPFPAQCKRQIQTYMRTRVRTPDALDW